MQAVLLSLPLLLLFIVFSCCLKGSWSYQKVHDVTWSIQGVTRTNHIEANFNDEIRFYCENTNSDVFLTTSKQDYDNCNVDAYGLEIGTCHANPVFIRNVIFKERYYPYPQFEVNTMYYYYSRQGSECANGVKLTLTVVTNTPTIGGSDDGNDSLLDKVSQYYYALVIGVIVLIVLVLLSILTLFIVCYKRSKELLAKSISREVTNTDNEIHVQASTEERVELKETKNVNFVATYKRKDDSPGSVPHTNRPAPPPPPTTNSVKNAFNVESKMSSGVQSSSSRSVPATRSNGNNRVSPVASLPASSPQRQAPSAPPPPSSLGNSKRLPPPPYKK